MNNKINLNVSDLVSNGSYAKTHKIVNCTSKTVHMKDHNDNVTTIPVSAVRTSRSGQLMIQSFDGQLDAGKPIIGDTVTILEKDLKTQPAYVNGLNCIVGFEYNIDKVNHPAAESGYDQLMRSANHDAIMARIGTGVSYNLLIDGSKVKHIADKYYVQPKDHTMPMTVIPQVISLNGEDMQLEVNESRPVFNEKGELILNENGQPKYHTVTHLIKSINDWQDSGQANVIELKQERSFIVVSDNEKVCMSVSEKMTSELHSKYSSMAQTNVQMQNDHNESVIKLKSEHQEEMNKLNKQISSTGIDNVKLKEQVQTVESERDEYKVIIGKYKADESQNHAEKIAASKESVASSNSTGATAKADSVTWQAWAAMGATAVTVVGGLIVWTVKTSSLAALTASGIAPITAAACVLGLCVIPAVVKTVAGILSDVADIVCEVVSGVIDIACDVIDSVVETVSNVVSTVVDTVCDITRGVVDSVCGVVGGICSTISGIFSW